MIYTISTDNIELNWKTYQPNSQDMQALNKWHWVWTGKEFIPDTMGVGCG